MKELICRIQSMNLRRRHERNTEIMQHFQCKNAAKVQQKEKAVVSHQRHSFLIFLQIFSDFIETLREL